MKCKNCGFENRSSVKFCEECGQALDKPARIESAVKHEGMTCPSCGRANRPDVKFCEECGQALDKPVRVASAAKRESIACPSCGHANRPGVQFCEECGSVLAPKQRAISAKRGQTQGVNPMANVVCPACGHGNRAGVQFCEECGAVLTGSRMRRLGAGLISLRRNPKKFALGALAFAMAVLLIGFGMDRLRYPVTKGEARDMAGAIIAAYYPELADVAPRVQEIQGGDGEPLLSYSYTKTVTAQTEDGSALQFTVGAVVTVDRKTGDVEVITIR
ncbi:MAG: zinc-ribbon domain-containing protein [Chloroflexi bacterium]|nr:zinc-ribbon domain-containing protein [Chloroflexota bacterium]